MLPTRRLALYGLSALPLLGLTGCGDRRMHVLLERAHEGDDLACGELMAVAERGSVSGFDAFAVGQAYDPGLFSNGDARRAAKYYSQAQASEPKGAHNLAVLVLTGQLSEIDATLGKTTLQQLLISAAERGVAESVNHPSLKEGA